jgi:alpha-glucosidase
MRDIPIKRKEDVQDPIGKRFWPFFKGRDGCRSPMQWNASPKGGFTSGDPWLPLHENVLFRNVENQQADSSSLYHFYKKLIHIRRESMPLRRGMYMPITFEPRRLLAYTRQIGDETVLVALNFSRRKTSLVVSSSITRQNWELLLSNKRTALPVVSDRKISLAPYEALLLKTV